MSKTSDRQSTFRSEGAYLFQCDHCGSERVTTAISYNQFGYAICPVCARHQGPL